MTRLALIVTVTFFLFAFSHAHTPLDLPENDVTFSKESSSLDLPEENDVTIRDLSNSLLESETKTKILLPSEKPESEPATVVELEAETVEDKSRDSETIAVESTDELPVSETDTVTGLGVTQPLMYVNFHPVNRHFNRMHDKRPFPGRFPHRCRHHFKQGSPRFNGREIPYGNDMILSKDNAISDPMFKQGMPQIPARWIRFHQHGRPRFPHRHHEWNEEDVKRPHHHMHEREETEKEHEEREDGGLMKSFRKFLPHF